MITSRLLKHLKQQHWTSVFIELVIVVLGVFLGLQAQDWNQARQDRVLERQYLERLHYDVTQSIAMAKSNVQRMQRQYRLEGAMLDDLSRCQLDAAARKQFGAGLFLFGRIEPPPLVRGTIDELRSTGRIGLIHDVALRTALASVVQVNDLENGVLNMIIARATPAITHIDERVVFKQPPGGFDQPDIEKHGMPDGRAIYDFPALCKDPQFAPAVSTVQNLTHVEIQMNQGKLRRFPKLLDNIDRDLDGMKKDPP